MSWTTLSIKGHETGWQVRGLILCCIPAHRPQKNRRGWRKDPGRGWRFGRSGRWMKVNTRGTQRPWQVIPMSSGTTGIDTTFCQTFLGQQYSPCGKGKSRSSGTMLGETVRLRQSSRAKAWILLVLRQIQIHHPLLHTLSCLWQASRAHMKSPWLAISKQFGSATYFQTSSCRIVCLLHFVCLWLHHIQVKRITFHYTTQHSLLQVGVMDRGLVYWVFMARF